VVRHVLVQRIINAYEKAEAKREKMPQGKTYKRNYKK
jgi:phosphate starvation-inducible protein PhoH